MLNRIALTLILSTALLPASSADAETLDESELSHINGQLVKVGEHNEYKHDFKRFNVSTNPIGPIYGSYSLAGSYAFHDNVAIRGDVTYMTRGEFSAFEAAVSAPLYLRRAYQGAFVEPGLVVRTFDDYKMMGPQVLIGYQSTWDSGFNISAAVGVSRTVVSNESDSEEDGDILPNGYLRVGYSF